MIEHFAQSFERNHNVNILENSSALAKLRVEVEKAKIELSKMEEVTIQIDSLIEDIDFCESLTRAQFEALNDDLFQETLKHVDDVIREGGLTKADIHEVILGCFIFFHLR